MSSHQGGRKGRASRGPGPPEIFCPCNIYGK